MSNVAIQSPHVVKTKGPYVQGVAVTDAKMIFTSGVVARDVTGEIVGLDDIRIQTRQCLENIRHIIEAGGGQFGDIVKVTVFLRRPEDYAGMNEVRRAMLDGIAFASSTIQSGLNAADALVEIEAVAAVSLPSV